MLKKTQKPQPDRKGSCFDRISFLSDMSPMGTERAKNHLLMPAGRNDKAEL